MSVKFGTCAECHSRKDAELLRETVVWNKVKLFCSDKCWQRFKAREFGAV